MNSTKTTILIAVSLIVLMTVLSVGTTQQPTTPRKTLFASLKVGQPVTLRERGPLYEISTLDEAASQTHKVVEIGDDFVVLQDEAQVTETRIPVTAIRAVVHLKTKQK